MKMKKGFLPLALVMSSLTASTYLITIDKKFSPYYNTTSKWASTTSDFTTWSPSEANYYTYEQVAQSRSCKNDNTRVINYKVNSTGVGSYNDTNTVNITQNQTIAGTKETIVQQFNFNSEGWSPVNGLTAATTPNPTSGLLRLNTTTNDPMIYLSGLSIDSVTVSKIIVRARFKNISGTTMQLFWNSSNNGGLNEADSARVSLHNVSNVNTTWTPYTEYTLDVSNWTGIISQVRLDPFSSGVSSTSYLEIDWIKFVK
jgi:hypothetical protein